MQTLAEVILKILANPQRITETFRSNNELFFKYAGHCFSVLKRTEDIPKFGDYSLYVYPSWNLSLQNLDASFTAGEDQAMVAYNVKEFPEIRELLVKLYKLIEEKEHGIDGIFSDILDS